MTRRTHEHASSVIVVGRDSVGVDNIDIVVCTDDVAQVVNTPEAVTERVVEHTIGLILDLTERTTYSDKGMRTGNFNTSYRTEGRELRGRTLGVVGCGRIGRRVAQACHAAFGMKILYTDVMAAPELEQSLGAKRVSLAELLAQAEYVTVHVPLLPET